VPDRYRGTCQHAVPCLDFGRPPEPPETPVRRRGAIASPFHIGLAGVCQLDGFTISLKEPNAELGLYFSYVSREHRLTDAGLLRREGEAQFLEYGNHRLHVQGRICKPTRGGLIKGLRMGHAGS